MAWISINDVMDSLVTLLQGLSAVTYPNLGAVPNDLIQYCEKDPRDINAVVHEREVWVAPITDRIQAGSVGRGKDYHHPMLSILSIFKSIGGVTNKKEAIKIGEDIYKWISATRQFTETVSSQTIHFADDGDILAEFSHQFQDKDTINFMRLDFEVFYVTTL